MLDEICGKVKKLINITAVDIEGDSDDIASIVSAAAAASDEQTTFGSSGSSAFSQTMVDGIQQIFASTD